ncbi:MAG TPA: ferritin-like domain-containing protein [Chloroflexota bacterium]|nr:ferritin-like domain-containing protein [Chloroflexota bacterium]
MQSSTHNSLAVLANRGMSRRSLFKGVAAAGLVVAMGPLFHVGVAFAQDHTFTNDLDVLNYALTLEHLEATLYNTLVGSGVIKNDIWLKYVKTFQEHENIHAQELTKAISAAGGTPVKAKDKYDFSAFDVSTELKQMQVLAAVEEVGVGAYQGAAGFIKDKGILTTAVAIHGVEAEHTGSMHHLLGLKPTGDSLSSAAGISTKVLNGAFTNPIPVADVLKAIGPILGN